MILRTTAENWFNLYLCPTINLLHGFIESTETQIKNNIDHFEKNKKGIVINYGQPEWEQYATEYNGLTSDEWDLNAVFGEYYPSLHRRSAFLTLVGIFEHEFHKLCDHCHAHFELDKSLSDLKWFGLEKTTKYLRRHVGIETHKHSEYWRDIIKILELRNSFAHQDGKAFNDKGDIPKITQHVKENDFLSIDDGNEVVIHAGYLQYVSDIYFKYFELLNSSLQERL